VLTISNDYWKATLQRVIATGSLLAMQIPLQVALAAGTVPGTDITNQATATYDLGGITGLTRNSNTTSNTVAELLDVNVTWQDAANVTVSPGDTDQVLTYAVTNTGNGSDTYNLAALSILTGDTFDPSLVDIYIDDGDGVFNTATDALYIAGSGDPLLPADTSVTVFLVNDIPAMLPDGITPVPDGGTGDSQLTVTSTTGTVTGTVVAGGGDGGSVDAVVGTSGGTQTVNGTYVASNTAVAIVKSAAVSDPFGGNEPVPGAIITYSIVVTVSGSGTADNVIVTDSIPANTSYNDGTLSLNAAGLTDTDADDEGSVTDTNTDTLKDLVAVDLGSLSAVSAVQTVSFQVTIN